MICRDSLAGTGSSPGREEPLLAGRVEGHEGQTYWELGEGWVAHIDMVPRQSEPRWRQWLEQVGRKVGIDG